VADHPVFRRSRPTCDRRHTRNQAPP
jgi:hypothetical protein